MSKLSVQLVRDLFQTLLPPDPMSPVDWACRYISFKNDVTAAYEKFDINLTPYLRDVINYWDFVGKIRELTVVAPEQTGKTLGGWIIGLLYSMLYNPCLSLVCYPSEDLSEMINSQKLRPLMEEIPELAKELAMPRSTKKDCYNFSNLKSYFMGAGSRVTSVSAKIRVADEPDDWIIHEGQVANVQDLRKRARSFHESLFAKVCTPTREHNTIWQEFKKSSMGYWHLRCQKCGELTMRSCDIHNLQFEVDNENNLKPETIVLVCPKCGNEHKENEKRKMNLEGDYKHVHPNRFDTHAGFQWGALASQMPTLSWEVIANAQLLAGRSGDLQDQIYFDNSIRGLPFKQRRDKGSEMVLKKRMRRTFPDDEQILYRFMAIDTQDNGFWFIVRGIDANNNSWLLKEGRLYTNEALIEAWNSNYAGKPVNAAIIDAGGHRGQEIAALIKDETGFFLYRGDTRVNRKFKLSENNKKLILANPRIYQSELLYSIYSAPLRESGNWYIPINISEHYIEQILDVKPNKKKKFGDDYENWEGSGNDHLFDCEKMWFVIREFSLIILNKQQKRRTKNVKEQRQIKKTGEGY